MNVNDILTRLLILQNDSRDFFPTGIFPSYRYHSLTSYQRADDNVYFTAFILIYLNEIDSNLENKERKMIESIISEGEKGLENYRNRFGDVTYNYYRSDGYFPNGKILSRFKRFQPTDDTDDTSIAYRAKEHDQGSAKKAKERMIYVSNGKRSRWNKKALEEYRKFETYNTWIGTDSLYVDLDICVIVNALLFSAKYNLDIVDVDIQGILFIEKAISTGAYLNKTWSLSAWYPFHSVIFFQLSELLALNYFTIKTSVKNQFVSDMKRQYDNEQDILNLMIIDLSFHKMGIEHQSSIPRDNKVSLNDISNWSEKFSYGVIPLLQPFNSPLFQKIGGKRTFQLRYQCEAQVLTFLLLWKVKVAKKTS